MNKIILLASIALFSSESVSAIESYFGKWLGGKEGEVRELFLYEDGACLENIVLELKKIINKCQYQIDENHLTIIYGDVENPEFEGVVFNFTIAGDRILFGGKELFRKEKTNKFKNEKASEAGPDAHSARPF